MRPAGSVRSDIADLWALYRSLNGKQRVQFLQAAAKWQEAIIHWQDRPSLSFALPDADDRQNCYDLIQALLGRTVVDRVRQNSFPAPTKKRPKFRRWLRDNIAAVYSVIFGIDLGIDWVLRTFWTD